MDSLDSMRVFVRVVHEGSLSAAARSLGLSPASVSRRIGTLEETIGTGLINRTSRRLVLTNAGHIYLEGAMAILEQMETLTDLVFEQEAQPRGTLTVHAITSVAERYFLDALPEFLAAYPKVTLRLSLEGGPRDFLDTHADVGVSIGVPAESSLTIRRLAPGTDRVLFASPDYIRTHLRIDAPIDLLDHNCITFLTTGALEAGKAIWLFRDAGGVKEIRVKGNFQVDSVEALKSAVRAGLGVAILPRWLVARDLAEGRVAALLERFEPTQTMWDYGIYAVFTKTPRISPKVRVFVDFLVKTFRDRAARSPAT